MPFQGDVRLLGGVLFPFGVAEVVMARPGGDDEGVVGLDAVGQQDASVAGLL
jgi:hypothetical protein